MPSSPLPRYDWPEVSFHPWGHILVGLTSTESTVLLREFRKGMSGHHVTFQTTVPRWSRNVCLFRDSILAKMLYRFQRYREVSHRYAPTVRNQKLLRRSVELLRPDRKPRFRSVELDLVSAHSLKFLADKPTGSHGCASYL